MSNPLLQNISSSDTTILVIGGIQSPVNAGVIQIESELIHYTSASDDAYTGCTRGYEGTAADSHLKGKAVSLVSSDVIPDLADVDEPSVVAVVDLVSVHADISGQPLFVPSVTGL